MTAVNIFKDKNGTLPHTLLHCNSPSQRHIVSPSRCIPSETQQDKILILEIDADDVGL